MAVMFTVGLLLASWSGVTVLAGLVFAAGCGLAAWYTRPPDLLTVVLAPPVLFSAALVFVQAVTASGSLMLSVVAGSVVTLTSLAPWLLAGMLLTVAIAWRRGLRQCLKDFRRDLRSGPAKAGLSGPGTLRSPRPGGPSRGPLSRPARSGAPRQIPRDPGGNRPAGPASRGPGRPRIPGPSPKPTGTSEAGQRSPGSSEG